MQGNWAANADWVGVSRRIGAVALGMVVCFFARFAFSKFQKYNGRALASVLGCLFSGTVLTYLTSALVDPIAQALYPVGLLLGFLIPVVHQETTPPLTDGNAGLFQRVRRRLAGMVGSVPGITGKAECRVFLYGLSRSGKSTLVDQLLNDGPPASHESTMEFAVHRGTVSLNGQKQPLDVALCDYKGQRPSQVLMYGPKEFFGTAERRAVNILGFVVDCIPELRDVLGTRVLSDEEVVQQYSTGAAKRIKERVGEHLEYVGQPTIQMAFSACQGDKFFAVLLIVNKLDLLEAIVRKGYLKGVKDADVQQFIQDQYSGLYQKLQVACQESHVTNVSFDAVSAKTGSNVKRMFGSLFGEYIRRFGPRP